MNFFKQKEADIAEISREKRVKSVIISELSAVLRSIQETQLKRPGEPIYASDSVNHLCNIFEAVFLHGHKSTQKVKGLQKPSLAAFEQCTFWSFVQKLSHKDVVNQLKKQTRIKTEIGMCRAWIKLAINDGLMESYINAIQAQPKLAMQYYNSTAFLLDLEQPGILTRLISVLNEYSFQLVVNSSDLNSWTVKTLSLAALIDRPFISQSGMSAEVRPQTQKQRSLTLDMDDVFEGPSSVLSSSTSIGSFVDTPDGGIVQDPRHSLQSSAVSNTDSRSLQSIHSKTSVNEVLQTFNEGDVQPEQSPMGSVRSSSTDVGNYLVERSVRKDAAVQELARLKTLRYSIDDVINAEETDKKHQTDQLFESESLPVNDAAVKPSLEQVNANMAGSFSSDGINDEIVYGQSSKSYTTFLDEESPRSMNKPASMKSQLSESPGSKIDFIVGTPGSEIITSSEHRLYEDSSHIIEDEQVSCSEEESQRADIEELQEPSSQTPISAAKAILKKRLSSDNAFHSSMSSRLSSSLGAYNRAGAVSGSPLNGMIHGNSLSSLVGWGSVESLNTGAAFPATMPKVQSFAEMVSELKQTETENLLASSTTHHPPAVFEQTILEESSRSDIQSHQCSDDRKNTDKIPDDDFLLVGEIDKENCADILAHYGEICTEQGLDSQDFKCSSCSAPIGIIYGFALVCAYTKKYYCPSCHINEDSYIPSKIVFNWDFTRYKVSKASRDFLTSAESMPLLNIQYLNKLLYDHIPELEKIKHLRTQLFYLKRYLFACNPLVADELKAKFWPKEYLYEEIHTYSVQDLIIISTSASLLSQIKKGVSFAREHVRGCQSCEYRGFICEICNSAQVIFPFDIDTTRRCDKCNAVYHKLCFLGVCPKCERIHQRNILLGKSLEKNHGEKNNIFFDVQ